MVLTEAPAFLDSPVALDLLVLKVNLVLPASLAALVAQDQLDPSVDPDLKVNQERQVSPVALDLLDLKEDPDPKVAQDPLAKMAPLVAQDLLDLLELQEQLVVQAQFQPLLTQLNSLLTKLSNRHSKPQHSRLGQVPFNLHGLLQLSPHSGHCNPPTDDRLSQVETIC